MIWLRVQAGDIFTIMSQNRVSEFKQKTIDKIVGFI